MSIRALVQDYMTPAPVIINDTDPASSVIELLTRNKISGAPVVDAKRKVVGVVSVTDLIAYEVLGARGRLNVSDEEDSMVSSLNFADFREQTAGELMSRPARTVDAHKPLGQAAHDLVRFGIHRLVVLGQLERIEGILSTMDITRAAADSSIRVPVSRIMSRRPAIWIRPDEDTREALRRLQSGSVTALLVVDGGKPMGFVSQAELVSSLHSADPVKVGDVLSTKLLQIDAKTPVSEAAAALVREGQRRLLVMEHGKPAGIVTSTDITRAVDPHSSALG